MELSIWSTSTSGPWWSAKVGTQRSRNGSFFHFWIRQFCQYLSNQGWNPTSQVRWTPQRPFYKKSWMRRFVRQYEGLRHRCFESLQFGHGKHGRGFSFRRIIYVEVKRFLKKRWTPPHFSFYKSENFENTAAAAFKRENLLMPLCLPFWHRWRHLLQEICFFGRRWEVVFFFHFRLEGVARMIWFFMKFFWKFKLILFCCCCPSRASQCFQRQTFVMMTLLTYYLKTRFTHFPTNYHKEKKMKVTTEKKYMN